MQLELKSGWCAHDLPSHSTPYGCNQGPRQACARVCTFCVPQKLVVKSHPACPEHQVGPSLQPRSGHGCSKGNKRQQGCNECHTMRLFLNGSEHATIVSTWRLISTIVFNNCSFLIHATFSMSLFSHSQPQTMAKSKSHADIGVEST